MSSVLSPPPTVAGDEYNQQGSSKERHQRGGNRDADSSTSTQDRENCKACKRALSVLVSAKSVLKVLSCKMYLGIQITSQALSGTSLVFELEYDIYTTMLQVVTHQLGLFDGLFGKTSH